MQDSAASAEERFAWFPLELAPGVLYGFRYNAPPDIRAVVTIASGQGPAEG